LARKGHETGWGPGVVLPDSAHSLSLNNC